MKAFVNKISTLFITLLFVSSLSAQITGNTFYVTNINDSGAGSFRQAMFNATATTATGVFVYFSLPAGSTTITLQSEVLLNYTNTATKNIYIYGSTTTQIILAGIGTQVNNCIRNPSVFLNLYVYSLQFQNFNAAINSWGYTVVGYTGVYGNIFLNNNRGVSLFNRGVIQGNYFGTNKSFSTGLGNYVAIEWTNGYNIDIIDNYICSNSYGIYAHNVSEINIKNNIIGTNNTSGTRTDLGNTYTYYGYNPTSGNGSRSYFFGNTIAYTAGTCLILDFYAEIEKNDFICNYGTIIYNRAAPYPTPIITSLVSDHYGGVSLAGTSNTQGDSIVIFAKDPTISLDKMM